MGSSLTQAGPAARRITVDDRMERIGQLTTRPARVAKTDAIGRVAKSAVGRTAGPRTQERLSLDRFTRDWVLRFPSNRRSGRASGAPPRVRPRQERSSPGGADSAGSTTATPLRRKGGRAGGGSGGEAGGEGAEGEE
jgi:hypothetical protein